MTTTSLTPEGLAEAYTYRELAKALAELDKGPPGFDLFRDERTRGKRGLAEYILTKHGASSVKVAARFPLAVTGENIRTESRSGGGGGGGGGGAGADGADRETSNHHGTEEGPGKGGKGKDGEGAPADGEGQGEGQGEGEQGDGSGEGQDSEFKPEQGKPGEDPISKAIREKLNERLGEMHKAMQQRLKSAQKQAQKAMEQAAKNAAQEQGYKGIEVKTPGKEPIKLDGHVHPAFEKVLKLASTGRLNILLKGPAGCGKTHLYGMVLKALGRTGASISGSAGASESQLLGRLLPTGEGGKFEYHAAPFIECYEGNLSGFLFDEIDAFDPNMLIVTNQATSNGGFTCELRRSNQYIKRGDVLLMAAANTFGTGADALYVGRNQLDAATLDRWYIVEMDYDRAFEKTLGPKELVEWVWKAREGITASRLRRVMSTRAIMKGAAALEGGLDLPEVKRDLLAGWSKDELAKIGVSV